jgi:hypothetical protein
MEGYRYRFQWVRIKMRCDARPKFQVCRRPDEEGPIIWDPARVICENINQIRGPDSADKF